MFQQARETSYLESTSLVVQAFRWRKPLLITTCLAAIGSFIFSGPAFITPKYHSSVVFFPPATSSLSKALLEENTSDKQDILAFGAEEQAEQILQILNSDVIRDAIIRKYDLMNHYGINPSEEFPVTRLNEEYRENISFARTEFMSVRIDVLDRDPQTAADIANDIASLMDSTKSGIQRERALEALAVVETAYQRKLADMAAKEDSLAGIRRRGVIDYTNQSKIWSEEYAKSYATFSNEKASLTILESYYGQDSKDTTVIQTKARIGGALARLRSLQQKMDLLADFGGASVSLTEELEIDRKDASRLKAQLDKLKIDSQQGMSNKFIVNKANKSERKATPVRWLIIVLSTLGTLLVSFILLLFLDRIRQLEV